MPCRACSLWRDSSTLHAKPSIMFLTIFAVCPAPPEHSPLGLQLSLSPSVRANPFCSRLSLGPTHALFLAFLSSARSTPAV